MLLSNAMDKGKDFQFITYQIAKMLSKNEKYAQ